MVMAPPTGPNMSPRRMKKPKPKLVNPIEAAIKSWFENLPLELLETLHIDNAALISKAPKRWVVYPPMVLLPAGSFDEEWRVLLQTFSTSGFKKDLWTRLLANIGRREGKGALTHLAINSGIPLLLDPNKGLGFNTDVENVLRTPSGMLMLYGEFGPPLSPGASPSMQDFEDAFWVSTKQNGITQTWAPRYTMFSRGNVKEKARLLDFHKPGIFDSRVKSVEQIRKSTAIDLYAGIGYFVFSYVKMGIGRAIGWELNPWSVEGLRRGAAANGWSVKVVTSKENFELGDERIVVFCEDNTKAAVRLKAVGDGMLGSVMHVNGGLLPTSEMSWKMALEILGNEGWLHLHENVGFDDILSRKAEVEQLFEGWLRGGEDAREVKVEHLEFVKTFAPSVWHCVFDVSIKRNILKVE